MGAVSLVKVAPVGIQDQTPDVDQKPFGFTAVVVTIHAAYATMVILSGAMLACAIAKQAAVLQKLLWGQSAVYALLAILFLIRSFHRPGKSRKVWIVLHAIAAVLTALMALVVLFSAPITPPSSTDGCMSSIPVQTKEASPYLIDGNIDVWVEHYAPSGGGLNADMGPGPYQPPCPPE